MFQSVEEAWLDYAAQTDKSPKSPESQIAFYAGAIAMLRMTVEHLPSPWWGFVIRPLARWLDAQGKGIMQAVRDHQNQQRVASFTTTKGGAR